MFEKLNSHVRTIKENVVLGELPFKALKDFIGRELVVEGFFFTNSKYGKQVVIIADNTKINMPERAVQIFEQVQKDEKMLNAMLEGHMMLYDIRSIETKNGTSTSFSFKDC